MGNETPEGYRLVRVGVRGRVPILHKRASDDLTTRQKYDLRYREAPRQAPRVPSRILQEEAVFLRRLTNPEILWAQQLLTLAGIPSTARRARTCPIEACGRAMVVHCGCPSLVRTVQRNARANHAER